jgi:hypothetical protein
LEEFVYYVGDIWMDSFFPSLRTHTGDWYNFACPHGFNPLALNGSKPQLEDGLVRSGAKSMAGWCSLGAND